MLPASIHAKILIERFQKDQALCKASEVHKAVTNSLTDSHLPPPRALQCITGCIEFHQRYPSLHKHAHLPT